jgi:cyclase
MAFTKGLHELGSGAWAYLQPDGSWGYSNAGLIVDGEESLLVDTLFDEVLTAEMLASMKDATGIGGADITTLVNTHANGDHTYGNRLAANAEIVASSAGAREMNETPPEVLASFVRQAPSLGELGEYFMHCFGAFQFDGIEMRYPTRTFDGELTLRVGDKTAKLMEVGPAHTAGDVLAYVPADRVVYTGDILFIDGTPIMWAGPVENWIDACDRILEMDVDHIVPGHGPLTDKAGVRRMRDYLAFVDAEARKRFEAGMSAADAAFDIDLGEYRDWPDFERIVVTVDSLYRHFGGDVKPPDVAALFGMMGRMYRERRGG